MATRPRTYFDHAASTPVAPEVLRAMQPYFSEKFGNPGSLHSFGQEAMAAVDRARETLAAALGADFHEVIFTGSATEANNLALRGVVRAAQKAAQSPAPAKIVISAIEHESVLETAAALEKEGVEVVRVPVGRTGVVKPVDIEAALDERTVLVSIMYANNETGAVQPLAKISKAIREFRAHRPYPFLHTDAAQAFQFLDCRPDELGVDLLTLSAHKIYGPKGIGALYIRRREKDPNPHTLTPIFTGGGQEFGLRSGTENVPLMAGFAAAVEYIEKGKEKHARRIAALKEQFVRGVMKAHPKARLNGPGGAKTCLPHIANIWLPGLSAQELLIRLDLAGIAVAAGSACTARSSQPSHVLLAMGLGEKRVRESLRVSFGRANTPGEIKKVLKALVKIKS